MKVPAPSPDRVRSIVWQARATDHEDQQLKRAMRLERMWSKSDALREAVKHWSQVVERRHR